MEYEDYKRQKRLLEEQLSSLIVPGVEAVTEAGTETNCAFNMTTCVLRMFRSSAKGGSAN